MAAIYKQVGLCIRRARKDAGLSLDVVALRTGFSVERLRQIESGNLPIRCHELTALAAALEVSAIAFFGWTKCPKCGHEF